MSTAQKYSILLELNSKIGDYFLKEAVSVGNVSEPYGSDSVDPTIVIKFKDGSAVHVGNPSKVAYQRFARTV